MTPVWAHGMYRVKPGCASEFMRVWRTLARYGVAEFAADKPTILRDRDDPNLFVTFGAWDSLHTLRQFRASPFVAEHALALDDLLETGEARILDEAEGDE
jgi:quinol monooxygenase YgiN